VTTAFGIPSEAKQVLVQPDGRIIAAGNYYDRGFALARYLSNGTLDPTFGSVGRVGTDFGNYSYATSAALQPDGKIVVAGTYNERSFALARYRKNGNLDSSFGINGKVFTYFADSIAPTSASSVAIQINGKIVVAGSEGTRGFILVRYNADGSIDSLFATNGVAFNAFGGGAAVKSVVLQADGKILAAGRGYQDGFILARYSINGKLDSSFGSNGEAIAVFNYKSYGSAAAIQSDGNVVVVGTVGLNGKIGVARFKGGNTSFINNKSNVLNLKQQINSSIHLTPNPVKDVLNIEGLSSSTSKTISVIDNTGRIVQTAITSNITYTLNVKQLSPGMYLIKVDDKKKTTTLKFIKE
jgi:uncharacterized delta-60 repeat protein